MRGRITGLLFTSLLIGSGATARAADAPAPAGGGRADPVRHGPAAGATVKRAGGEVES